MVPPSVLPAPALRPSGRDQDAAKGPAAPLQAVRKAVSEVIRGKDDVIDLALVTLISRGHLLIEDIPGVGKSTLARVLAQAVGGTFRRVQFTSDLLPADVIGVSVWRPQSDRFEFRPGPLFANFVLADEINRAPPRTQSALLEAMGEQQVSVDGTTHALPSPFMVIATQNPSEHHGTYALPESQRDRFAVRVAMGYAEAAVEAQLLREDDEGWSRAIEPVVATDDVIAAQRAAQEVFVHPDLAAYGQRVVGATRVHAGVRLGVSTRGALAWMRVARARALLDGREQISIDDLQELAVAALAHRIVLAGAGPGGDGAVALAQDVVREIVAATAVPR